MFRVIKARVPYLMQSSLPYDDSQDNVKLSSWRESRVSALLFKSFNYGTLFSSLIENNLNNESTSLGRALIPTMELICVYVSSQL